MIPCSIPLKNTEFPNQIYPLQVEITPFLDKNSVNQDITESVGSYEDHMEDPRDEAWMLGATIKSK